MSAKRFTYEYKDDDLYDLGFFLDNGKEMLKDDVLNTLNNLNEENKNLKALLNDFIIILNRLQGNPNDKQTLGVARDMLQNMGKEVKE